MARTTVGDCIEHTPNHFELVMGVVSRAKALDRGDTSKLPTEGDRNIVLALREIASGTHEVDLEAEILRSLSEDEALTAGQTPLNLPRDDGEGPAVAA